ncbi:MAG: hypothetical protein JKY31_00490 [Rhodobacteraceae bacterium]|nr:hypothetical protein [Paracoccaceae bacterium]
MAGIDPSSLVRICPKTLTDADWQKKKGKIGKLVKTGVGAELKKLQALMKRIDVGLLDPAASPSSSYSDLAEKVKAAKAEYSKNVQPMQKQCYIVRDKAAEAEKILRKKPLGGSAAKAAAAVSKAADHYGVSCKSLDLDARIATAKSAIDRKNMIAKKFLGGSLQKFVAGAKAFKSTPTMDSWESNIKQQGRSVSNSIKQLEAYNKQFWKDFEKFKGFDRNTLKIADQANFDAKAAIIVKMAVSQVKAIAAFKPQ